MNRYEFSLIVLLLLSIFSIFFTMNMDAKSKGESKNSVLVQLGPRPFYLVENMKEGLLKKELKACLDGPFEKSDFSIGHRGACLQFPEHTKESYVAAIRMGAGICECDVTFTSDKELVCRHSQCDLHTTTNILAIPKLAVKCSEPFTPAIFDPETGELIKPASAKCCTSDITLEEFKQLQGKMDGFNPKAKTVEAFIEGTPKWRTDLYALKGTLMTHKESIDLFKGLGVKMIPELKMPEVKMPYKGGYSQEKYAQQMIDEYKKAGIPPRDVFPQSFNLKDVTYWIKKEPKFGKQAIYLDGRYEDYHFDPRRPDTFSPSMEVLAKANVKFIAPPMWMLLKTDNQQNILPSEYATAAKAAGLKLMTWTMERSGPLNKGGGWYYQSIQNAIETDGDMLMVMDILARNVGVSGIFSDWPATVTFYANCRGLK